MTKKNNVGRLRASTLKLKVAVEQLAKRLSRSVQDWVSRLTFGEFSPIAVLSAPRFVGFENLEGRQLMATIGLTSGKLSITGDLNITNTISVGLSSDGKSVIAKDNALTRTFVKSQVSSISITGGDRNDVISIQGNISTSAVIDAKNGFDTVFGGSGNDRITGGDGNDSVNAGSGNDTIFGGNGNDRLDGGAGSDQADAGAGSNVLISVEGKYTPPPPPVTIPNAPNTLSARGVSSSSIALSWNDASSNETGFKLERSTNNGSTFSQFATVGANVKSYTAASLANNTKYLFRVRSYNNAGNSDYTNTPTVTLGTVSTGGGTNTLVPATPDGLVTKSLSSSSISLTWNDRSTNETGFKLERSTDNGTTFTQFATTGANVKSYNAGSLANNTKYLFRVRSYNTAGNSNYSNTATTTLGTVNPTPTAPDSLATIGKSTSSITLTWADKSTNESGFKIERSTDDGATFTQIATVGANVKTYTAASLANNTKHTFRVRAYNAGGDSAYTNISAVTLGTVNTNTGGGGTTTGGGTSVGVGGTGIFVSPSAVKPTVVITAVTATTINAGQAVHLQATNTKLNSGNWLNARFEWDFGDSSGTYNKLVGFNAAHVYKNPGTYTATLKVYNASNGVASSSMTIKVNAAGRRSIYVASDGSDSNNGSSPSSPVKTFAKAELLLGNNSNTEVLFRRGDTFGVLSTMELGGNNVRIGDYGSGNQPVLKWTGGKGYKPIFWQRGSATSTLIENVTFDTIYTGPDKTQIPDATSASGLGLTIKSCTFLNVGYGMNALGTPRGLLMQDCVAPSKTGVKSYLSWVLGSDHVYLGNTMVNSTREHIIRVAGADRVLIAYNNFTNDAQGNPGDGTDTSKNTLTIHKGNFCYVVGNTLNKGPFRVGPLGEGDGLTDKPGRFNWTVIEGNTLNTMTNIMHGANHTMIRNNISNTPGYVAYQIDAFNSQYGRGVSDVSIVNNTGFNSATGGNFIKVGGPVDGINVVNNLYVAPELRPGATNTAPVYVNGSNLSSFRTVTNNVWATGKPLPYAANGTNYIWTNWSDSRGYQDANEWNALPQVGTDFFTNTQVNGQSPASGTVAARSGVVTAGVFVDKNGKARPGSGSWSVGAVQV